MHTPLRLCLIFTLACGALSAAADDPAATSPLTQTSGSSSLDEVDAFQWVSRTTKATQEQEQKPQQEPEKAAAPYPSSEITAKSPVLLPATLPAALQQQNARSLSSNEPVNTAPPLKEPAVTIEPADAPVQFAAKMDSSTSDEESSRRKFSRNPRKKTRAGKTGPTARPFRNATVRPVVTEDFSFRFLERVQYEEDANRSSSYRSQSDSPIVWENDHGAAKPYWSESHQSLQLRIAQAASSSKSTKSANSKALEAVNAMLENQPTSQSSAPSSAQSSEEKVKKLLESVDEENDEDSEKSEPLNIEDPVPTPVSRKPTSYAATLGDVLQDEEDTTNPQIEQQYCDEVWRCAGGRCQNSYDRMTRELRRNVDVIWQGNCNGANKFDRESGTILPVVATSPLTSNAFPGVKLPSVINFLPEHKDMNCRIVRGGGICNGACGGICAEGCEIICTDANSIGHGAPNVGIASSCTASETDLYEVPCNDSCTESDSESCTTPGSGGGCLEGREAWSLWDKMTAGHDCRWKIGGWTQAGYHDAANGLFNDHPDRFNVHQQWLFAERAADPTATGRGWDWGFRADIVYGVDAQDTQAFGNPAGTFDFANGFDHGIYGVAIPQVYAQVATEDLSIIVGHFFTLIGYEVVTAPDNFFYSHAMTMYNSEPFTHTGVLGTYSGLDHATIYAGWTAGWDTGFERFNDGNSFLGGVSLDLTDQFTATYMTTFGNFGSRGNGYSHSIVFDWGFADKWNAVVQSDLLQTREGEDNVGVNSYLFYDLSDTIALGTRAEWWKADTISGYAPFNASLPANTSSSYYAATVGANLRPCTTNLVFRPEARYNWSPAADYGEWQFGVDMVLSY